MNKSNRSVQNASKVVLDLKRGFEIDDLKLLNLPEFVEYFYNSKQVIIPSDLLVSIMEEVIVQLTSENIRAITGTYEGDTLGDLITWLEEYVCHDFSLVLYLLEPNYECWSIEYISTGKNNYPQQIINTFDLVEGRLSLDLQYPFQGRCETKHLRIIFETEKVPGLELLSSALLI